MPHKHIPIIVLEELKNIIPEIIKLVRQNESIVEIIVQKNLEFTVKDKEPLEDGTFYSFSMETPTFIQTKAVCQLTYRPSSVKENKKSTTFNAEMKQVLPLFEKWLNFIKTYSEYSILEEDSINLYYQGYYISLFESADEDSITKPFSLEQQIIVVEFINRLLLIINEDENNHDLINDAETIVANVNQNTKQTVVRQISNLLAKAHQKSLPLVKKFLEEAMKTIFKNITEAAIKGLREVIENPHKYLP